MFSRSRPLVAPRRACRAWSSSQATIFFTSRRVACLGHAAVLGLLGETVDIDARVIGRHVELAVSHDRRGELAKAEGEVPVPAVPQHTELFAAVAECAERSRIIGEQAAR